MGELGDAQLKHLMPKSQTDTLSIGWWNVIGIRTKIEEVEKVLDRKGVHICGFQETKANAEDIQKEPTDYNIVCFKRIEKAYGSAFFVRKGLIVDKSEKISDRICYIVVRKKTKFKAKETAKGIKIFRVKKKQSGIVVINAYAPHMGFLNKKPEEVEKFYCDLRKTEAKFKNQD